MCWLCSQTFQKEIVSQLQSKIAAFKMEVIELRAILDTKSEMVSLEAGSWSDVVGRKGGLKSNTLKKLHT